MTDEEIYRCYQILEEYRWRRQDFNRQLEQWFEGHHNKEHKHGNNTTTAPEMQQVIYLQTHRRKGREEERQLAHDLCVRPMEDGREKGKTDSQLQGVLIKNNDLGVPASRRAIRTNCVNVLLSLTR